MLILNIKNGLGNQMFQYAFGRVLEWKYNTKIYFDLLREKIDTPLKTDLDVFQIEPITEIAPDVANKFKPFSVRQYRDNKQYIKYIYYKLRRKFQSNRLITEPYPSQYLSIFNNLKINNKTYFLGFWQNYRYFVGYEDRIRKLFEPKDKSIFDTSIALEIINSEMDTISLHFRRGDYLTSGFIEPVSMEYYQKAIELMVFKFNNPYFFIFTDEPEWVKENFSINYPHKIISGNTGDNCYIDILLMSKCQNHIIANSTFSWWGAWLNSNPQKIVIAPKTWYGTPGRDMYTSEITPPTWIRL